ncbi:MAG: hypothetical protein IJF54_01085 [Clostridia bacterium]|nr:hypothetical protein [Clostridia bacterium]
MKKHICPYCNGEITRASARPDPLKNVKRCEHCKNFIYKKVSVWFMLSFLCSVVCGFCYACNIYKSLLIPMLMFIALAIISYIKAPYEPYE